MGLKCVCLCVWTCTWVSTVSDICFLAFWGHVSRWLYGYGQFLRLCIHTLIYTHKHTHFFSPFNLRGCHISNLLKDALYVKYSSEVIWLDMVFWKNYSGIIMCQMVWNGKRQALGRSVKRNPSQENKLVKVIYIYKVSYIVEQFLQGSVVA